MAYVSCNNNIINDKLLQSDLFNDCLFGATQVSLYQKNTFLIRSLFL